MNRNESIKAYGAWASVCFFWGTTYLAIRIGVEVLPPFLFAGIRFLIAGLVFVPFLLLKGYSLPNRKDMPHIIIVGLALLVFANATVVWSEQWISSSLAALIIATIPFWMIGIEAMLPQGDKFTGKKISGIILGFLGLVVLLWPDLKGTIQPGFLKGLLGLSFAPIAWSAGSIYAKHRTIKTRPLMAAAIQMLVAGVVLVIVGGIAGEFPKLSFNFQGWAATLYLVVFGSIVGYSSYIYALDKLPIAFVSTYSYLNPIVAIILGWLILNERLDWFVVLATTIILSGVILVKSASSNGKIKAPQYNKENAIKGVEETEEVNLQTKTIE